SPFGLAPALATSVSASLGARASRTVSALRSPPWRSTVICTASPGFLKATFCCNCGVLSMDSPSSVTITSPSWMPAFLGGELSADVDERPARVAGVAGGVGLDEILNGVARLLQPGEEPPLGADDAGRHREGERLPQRVPDGERPLAHAGRVRIAELHRGQTTRVDLDDGDVGVGIRPDDLGGELALVVQLHGDLVGAGADVVVREDIAVARDDEPRAGALLDLRPPPAGGEA